MVNGFVGGEVGPDGSLVVRRYHAHSWVEYFDGGRWVTLDPTPAIQAPEGPGPLQTVQEGLSSLWDSLVVEYDRGTQADVASELATAVVPFVSERRRAAVGAVVLGVLAGVVMMAIRVSVRRWMRRVSARPRPSDGVSRMLERAVSAVERAGVVVPPGPPVEAARALCADHPAVAEPLERLAWLSYEVRFGGVPARENLPRAKELLTAVRAGLRGASSIPCGCLSQCSPVEATTPTSSMAPWWMSSPEPCGSITQKSRVWFRGPPVSSASKIRPC